jgi:hypothetical protein
MSITAQPFQTLAEGVNVMVIDDGLAPAGADQQDTRANVPPVVVTGVHVLPPESVMDTVVAPAVPLACQKA